MKINVKDNHQNFDSVGVGNYTLEVDDNKVINSMTTKSPIYYYALINGKLFKSEQYKGLKSYLFNTKEKLEKAIAGGLYWKDNIIPHIGNRCGYDTEQFYKDLTENHTVEIKEFKF